MLAVFWQNSYMQRLRNYYCQNIYGILTNPLTSTIGIPIDLIDFVALHFIKENHIT